MPVLSVIVNSVSTPFGGRHTDSSPQCLDSVLIIADCESNLMVVAPGSTGQGAREAAFRRAREAFRFGIDAPLKEM